MPKFSVLPTSNIYIMLFNQNEEDEQKLSSWDRDNEKCVKFSGVVGPGQEQLC